MPSVFTCCWCIKLNYDPNCVYYTSFIFDAILFCIWGIYALALLAEYQYYWPHIVFLIFALLLLGMGIFAIVQIFTKNSSAASRHGQYVRFRLWAIIAYIVLAIVMLILWLSFGFSQKYRAGFVIGAAISAALPFAVDACLLHGYHENFK